MVLEKGYCWKNTIDFKINQHNQFMTIWKTRYRKTKLNDDDNSHACSVISSFTYWSASGGLSTLHCVLSDQSLQRNDGHSTHTHCHSIPQHWNTIIFLKNRFRLVNGLYVFGGHGWTRTFFILFYNFFLGAYIDLWGPIGARPRVRPFGSPPPPPTHHDLMKIYRVYIQLWWRSG